MTKKTNKGKNIRNFFKLLDTDEEEFDLFDYMREGNPFAELMSEPPHRFAELLRRSLSDRFDHAVYFMGAILQWPTLFIAELSTLAANKCKFIRDNQSSQYSEKQKRKAAIAFHVFNAISMFSLTLLMITACVLAICCLPLIIPVHAILNVVAFYKRTRPAIYDLKLTTFDKNNYDYYYKGSTTMTLRQLLQQHPEYTTSELELSIYAPRIPRKSDEMIFALSNREDRSKPPLYDMEIIIPLSPENKKGIDLLAQTDRYFLNKLNELGYYDRSSPTPSPSPSKALIKYRP